MAEKTSFRAASTFVPSSSTYIKHGAISGNNTVYSKNTPRQGTPSNSDYIYMTNRRKYVYNEKK